MRLKDKTAVVFGGGQSGGSTTAIGNGRATAMLFAREGATVLVVDRDMATAQETVDLITEEGNLARATVADVTDEAQVAAAIKECKNAWGKLDILHNNVGISAHGNRTFSRMDIKNLKSENIFRVLKHPKNQYC